MSFVGPHCFIVPIRDANGDHPGVIVEDMGMKEGQYTPTYNHSAQFHKCEMWENWHFLFDFPVDLLFTI